MTVETSSGVTAGPPDSVVTRTGEGLTVAQLLAEPALARALLHTSRSIARSRRITWASVHELPLVRPIRTGELVMTTGVGLQGHTDRFQALISEAASAKAAGVAVEIGVYIGHIPR